MHRTILLLLAIPILAVSMAGENRKASATVGAMRPGVRGAATRPAELGLDAALARACAVSLSEVADSAERDARPADGHLDVTVTLKTIRGSGQALTSVVIIKAFGGLSVVPGEPEADPLNPSPFRKGARYWFIWAGRDDVYPHRILRWWPADDGAPATELEAAIKADRYAWSPQYVPKAGLFYGRLYDPEKKQTLVRVTKDQKTLWERALPGAPGPDYFRWNVTEKQHHPTLTAIEAPKDDLFLWVENDVSLPVDNPYEQPAGAYFVNWFLDLKTGHTAVVQATRHETGKAGVWTIQEYDLKAQRIAVSRVNAYMSAGGKVVGAETEAWWKQVVRTYDPISGKLVSEETFRLSGPHLEPVKIAMPTPGK